MYDTIEVIPGLIQRARAMYDLFYSARTDEIRHEAWTRYSALLDRISAWYEFDEYMTTEDARRTAFLKIVALPY